MNNLMKYHAKVNEGFKDALEKKLAAGGIDEALLGETLVYINTNAQVMDRIIEGFQMWAGEEKTEDIDTEAFLLSMLKLMDIFRKNMEKRDGILSEYISKLHISPVEGQTKTQPWQYEGYCALYPGLRGIFKALRNMNLSQELIDKYYLDGTLMELFDDSIETVCALDTLNRTDNPSPYDLREGLYIIENRFRNFYNKLFIEKYDDVHGFYGCLIEVIKHIENSNLERDEK